MRRDETDKAGERAPKVDRLWAMGCHLAGLLAWAWPPHAFGLLGVLALWLLRRDAAAFVDEQGKEALNFQLSLLIYASVCMFLSFVGVGLLLFPLAVFGLVCEIVAGVKASEGVSFRYPLCLRLVK